jgi:dTDP-4-dehydrorhamnose reductase
VRDADAVERAFQDFAPRVVVHAAAMSHADACEADKQACWAVNVDAVATLAAACRRHGARLLLLSTDFVFDGSAGPYGESDRPAPLGAYGRSKLAAENALRTSRLTDWAIVRTTLVYGAPEGDAVRLDLVRWMLRELRAGRPVRVASDQRRTPTYDDDLAEGIERLIRFRKNGVFHLAGRDLTTPHDVSLAVARVFGLDAGLISAATTEALHPGVPRPLRAGLLILRAESEVGYRPRPLDTTLGLLRERLAASAQVHDDAGRG